MIIRTYKNITRRCKADIDKGSINLSGGSQKITIDLLIYILLSAKILLAVKVDDWFASYSRRYMRLK